MRGGGMTNGNEKLGISVGIGEATHDASIFDDTTRGDAEDLTLTARQRVACRDNE